MLNDSFATMDHFKQIEKFAHIEAWTQCTEGFIDFVGGFVCTTTRSPNGTCVLSRGSPPNLFATSR